MTDTHKPLPAAKVKELEAFMVKGYRIFDMSFNSAVSLEERKIAMSARNAIEMIQIRLQSLINEAEDE